MAKLDGYDMEGFGEWLATRPQIIQDMAKKTPPDRLYRLKSTGQRGYVTGYNEAGTLTLEFTGLHNLLPFNKSVFGIYPDDLTECEFPGPDEPVGTFLDSEDQEALAEALEAMRETCRELVETQLMEDARGQAKH